MKRQWLLSSRRDFRQVLRSARRIHRRGLVLFVGANGNGTKRFAVWVKRRAGTAVKRNRAKRVMKHALTSLWGDMPLGVDVIVFITERAEEIDWERANEIGRTVIQVGRNLEGE